jgi:hypothetical protein
VLGFRHQSYGCYGTQIHGRSLHGSYICTLRRGSIAFYAVLFPRPVLSDTDASVFILVSVDGYCPLRCFSSGLVSAYLSLPLSRRIHNRLDIPQPMCSKALMIFQPCHKRFEALKISQAPASIQYVCRISCSFCLRKCSACSIAFLVAAGTTPWMIL